MKRLDYFKRELNNVLDRQLEALEKKTVTKSFSEWVDIICKSSNRSHLVAKRVQAKNEKTGKVYMKTVYVNPDKVNGLKKYHEQDSQGAKVAIGKLKGEINTCKSSQELLDLVLKNKDRFSDERGFLLPIVKELSEWASGKNDELEHTPEGKTQKEHYDDLKKIKRRNAEVYNKKRAEHIRQDMKLNKVEYSEELLSRKEAAEKIAEYKNVMLENIETGLKASYNNTGAGKLISQKAVDKSIKNGFSQEEHFTIASHIQEVFKNANLVSIEPDRDSDLNDNVTEVRRYAVEFNLNGKKGFALMTVKLNKDSTKKLYALELNYLTKNKPVVASDEVKDNSNNENAYREDKSHRQTGSINNINSKVDSVNNKDVNKSINPYWQAVGI